MVFRRKNYKMILYGLVELIAVPGNTRLYQGQIDTANFPKN